MKSKGNFIIFLGMISILFFSGCATCRMTEPTIEELNAVSQYKKKVAVLGINDRNSQVAGAAEAAVTSVEGLLSRQFTLVERQRINAILHERNFIVSEDLANAAELGKLLGVDYLVFGTVTCSVTDPHIRNSSSTDEKGKFYGSIWKEQNIQIDISLKAIDAATGLVVYTDKRGNVTPQEFDRQTFYEKSAFEQGLKTVHLIDNIKEASGRAPKSNRVNFALVEQGIDAVVHSFRNALMARFPYKGQILEKVSPTEVLVNLGSAYGLQPGDRLVVYHQGESMVDPNTGMVINERIPKIILTIRDVTSGISCVAKGRADDIRNVQVGTVVYTSSGR